VEDSIVTNFNEIQIEFLKRIAQQITNERESLPTEDQDQYQKTLSELLRDVEAKIAFGNQELSPEG
jgi:hypothetical protein